MSVIRVPDKGGNCVTFRDVDGYWLPTIFQEDVFRECHKLNIREDDVIIINWMRSVDWKSWFDHVRSWERLFQDNPGVNVHFVHYEDLKLNLIQELQKLSMFLGLDRGITLLEAIAAKCTIGRMRNDKMKYTLHEKGLPVHYRKGLVGDWRNYFTVAQYEHFQRLYQEKMTGSRFQIRYSAAMD